LDGLTRYNKTGHGEPFAAGAQTPPPDPGRPETLHTSAPFTRINETLSFLPKELEEL